MPPSVEPSAIISAVEKSIPPLMRTIIAPNATKAVPEYCKRMLLRFSQARNLGLIIEMIPPIATNKINGKAS